MQVAVCSLLQCGAVCCSVLQCVVVCSPTRDETVEYRLGVIDICDVCSALQCGVIDMCTCVAACGSALQCVYQ